MFDKTPSGNWPLDWHQDRTIAVKHRIEIPGFGPWSMKGGVHHVAPPIDLLARMLIPTAFDADSVGISKLTET